MAITRSSGLRVFAVLISLAQPWSLLWLVRFDRFALFEFLPVALHRIHYSFNFFPPFSIRLQFAEFLLCLQAKPRLQFLDRDFRNVATSAQRQIFLATLANDARPLEFKIRRGTSAAPYASCFLIGPTSIPS